MSIVRKVLHLQSYKISVISSQHSVLQKQLFRNNNFIVIVPRHFAQSQDSTCTTSFQPATLFKVASMVKTKLFSYGLIL